ncbi:hypothetical protein NDU88_011851 [Pleurodeles waltl]|uniref:Uncharacterized protein n=1 Tax=Pleurodeles waltl TaxID=8319 RepID=A0AAV7R4K8_PLEWA|nr:hypothetical protein NDU88_011851 [Pleurodeles waltl]
MGRHKRTDASQGNTMEQYTTPVVLPQRSAGLDVSGEAAGVPLSAGELSRVELLVAIQGSRVALDGKTEAVAVKVNLMRADLRKVAEKVKVAEGSIAELRSEVGHCGRKWRRPHLLLDGWRTRKGGPGGTMSGCWAFQSVRRGLLWNPLWRTGSRTCCSW